jgi:hypothetical protein
MFSYKYIHTSYKEGKKEDRTKGSEKEVARNVWKVWKEARKEEKTYFPLP